MDVNDGSQGIAFFYCNDRMESIDENEDINTAEGFLKSTLGDKSNEFDSEAHNDNLDLPELIEDLATPEHNDAPKAQRPKWGNSGNSRTK